MMCKECLRSEGLHWPACSKYVAPDTVESLLREIVDHPRFQPKRGYGSLHECPMCNVWLDHGMQHQAGTAMGMNGPIVCWFVRAERVLRTTHPKDAK